MLQTVVSRLQELAGEPAALGLALLLGFLSAASSACCTLPAMAVLLGYSGAQAQRDRAKTVQSALFFTLGVLLSLLIIGGVIGYVGQLGQAALGSSWKVVAGIVAVAFGLAAMDLLPFTLNVPKLTPGTSLTERLGAAVAGLALGGIVAVSSLPCNPGIFIVIGAAVLQGQVVWSLALLAAFAVGFSLPLGALMLGVSLGRFALAAKGLDRALRYVSGAVLVTAGLYFVITA